MLDPISILGLAANVLQLISFTAKLVDKGCQLYTSVDGRLFDHELSTLSRRL